MFEPELTWFKVIVLIVSGYTLGVSVANSYYFNQIRIKNNCQPISNGTATTMVWLNIILAIVAAIIFFWSLFRLIFTGHEEKVPTNKVYNLHNHVHNSPDYEAKTLTTGMQSPIVASPIIPVPQTTVVLPTTPINSPGVITSSSFM